MLTQVTGNSPTANPLLDSSGDDTGSLGLPGKGMPADITAALNRMFGQTPLPMTTTPDPFAQVTPASSAAASVQSGADMAVAYDGAPAALIATAGATDSGGSTAVGDPAVDGNGAAIADPVVDAAPAPAVETMSEADINAALTQLLQSGDKNAIDNALNASDTPPEAKAALVQLKAVTNGERPQLTDSQLETLSILQRHRGDCGGKMKDLQSQIDDPKTPPDLKQALSQLRDDPALQILVDNGAHGGGINKTDGGWGGKDINGLSELPQLKEYNEKKAASYVKNYIPSDADPSVTEGRDMTENDALREMYLYSDYLPKKLSKKTLQAIVDGDAGMKKCPPQVIAAAKFMLDHPESWSKATENGKNEPSENGTVSRSAFLNNVSKDVYLTADEESALKTIDANRDVFLKSAMTRKSLQAIVDDPNTTPENKQASQKLLDDPLLFGILDNAKHGHKSKPTSASDDGKIGAGDIKAFMETSTTRGKAAPPLPKTQPATTPEASAAVADMAAGEVDDPAEKKKKGGGLSAILHKIGDVFLQGAAIICHGAAFVLSLIEKVPPFELLTPITMAVEGMGGGLDVARVALKGGDTKQALKMMAIGVGVSAVGIAGAGTLVKGGAKVAETVVAKAATEGAEKAAAKAAAEGAEKAAAKVGTMEQVKEGVVDTAADLAVNGAIIAAQKKPQLRQPAGQVDIPGPDAQTALLMQQIQQEAQIFNQV